MLITAVGAELLNVAWKSFIVPALSPPCDVPPVEPRARHRVHSRIGEWYQRWRIVFCRFEPHHGDLYGFPVITPKAGNCNYLVHPASSYDKPPSPLCLRVHCHRGRILPASRDTQQNFIDSLIRINKVRDIVWALRWVSRTERRGERLPGSRVGITPLTLYFKSETSPCKSASDFTGKEHNVFPYVWKRLLLKTTLNSSIRYLCCLYFKGRGGGGAWVNPSSHCAQGGFHPASHIVNISCLRLNSNKIQMSKFIFGDIFLSSPPSRAHVRIQPVIICRIYLKRVVALMMFLTFHGCKTENGKKTSSTGHKDVSVFLWYRQTWL